VDLVTTNVVVMVVPDVGATLSVPLTVIAVSTMISYVPLLLTLECQKLKVLTEKPTPEKPVITKDLLALITVAGVPVIAGVTDGAHIIMIVVMISMITVPLVMDLVVVVPEPVGVMNSVPLMVIVALISMTCVQLTILVMDLVVVLPVLAGVMISVLDMVIVALITKPNA
jgi:hypothetical protein